MSSEPLHTDVDRKVAAMFTMHVRQRIDPLRAKHLTDEQVGELTEAIRSAILDMVVAMRLGNSDDAGLSQRAHQFLAMIDALVPTGWQHTELGDELARLLRAEQKDRSQDPDP